MKADFRDVSLMVATHSFGSVTPPYAQSLAVLTGHLAMWRVSHSVLLLQDPFVDRGRDRIAAAFLGSGFSHLLMLDADIQFEPTDVARLVAANRPLVAGAYRYKNDTGHFAVSFPEGAQDGCQFDDEAQALEVDGVGAGFMLIRREVFERIEAATPDLAYVTRNDGVETRFHGFFDQDRDGDQRVGEDIAFCRRWQAVGGKVHVCPDIRLTHWGPQGFSGALMDQIRFAESVAAE
ncbi:hypothetical protein [Jannaschia formosa]|uniref:hypothetical protein n=1 Tax=Jannaschia formosa TaxID=2259592 RepID=UPI000E1B5F7B|nr:hypothetical protein [Jannaschia formosa]TFL16430.1 hypothetical protein DR046_20125 [Jannaschia formosa]